MSKITYESALHSGLFAALESAFNVQDDIDGFREEIKKTQGGINAAVFKAAQDLKSTGEEGAALFDKAVETVTTDWKAATEQTAVPRSYTQACSNIRQSLKLGLKPADYKSESALRKAKGEANKEKKKAEKGEPKVPGVIADPADMKNVTGHVVPACVTSEVLELVALLAESVDKLGDAETRKLAAGKKGGLPSLIAKLRAAIDSKGSKAPIKPGTRTHGATDAMAQTNAPTAEEQAAQAAA